MSLESYISLLENIIETDHYHDGAISKITIGVKLEAFPDSVQHNASTRSI